MSGHGNGKLAYCLSRLANDPIQMKHQTTLSFLFVFLAAMPLSAQDNTSYSPDTTKRSTTILRDTIAAIDPATLEGGIWIGIHGTIGMVGPNSFFLDYGDSTVIVGLAGEALREHDFLKGQKVTVFGRADKDLFERNVIKARAVAVEGVDGAEHSVITDMPEMGAITASYIPSSVVHGKVSAVTATRVVVDEGDDKISIDTSALGSAEPNVQVKQNDLVLVKGDLGREFWNSRTIVASSIEVIDPNASAPAAGTDRHPDDRE